MQLIFSPSVFKIFFLSLVLKNVASMCPRVIFFIFLVMGFVELPGSMALQVSSIFQCFYIFTQFSPFLLSFGDTNYTCIWLSEMFSQLRDALFFFFFLVSFLYEFHFTYTPLLVCYKSETYQLHIHSFGATYLIRITPLSTCCYCREGNLIPRTVRTLAAFS